MRNHHWQGFPATVQRGDKTTITLRWRCSQRMRYRKSLVKVGVIAALGFAIYGYLWGSLSRYDPLLLVAAFLVWLAVVVTGASALTWRKRVVEVTPQFISFAYRMDFKRLQRALPHGFRLQPFHVPLSGQLPQHGQPMPFVHQNFYLFLDHAEQTCLLAEIYGAKTAELLLRRLSNVAEFYKQRYAHQQGMDAHHGEDAPRSTFNRRVAI